MLSATKPKNCMKKSVRYAPTRREAKRAAKSAMPQHTAPVNPRMMPNIILRDGRLFAFWLQTEEGHYFLQSLPDFALRIRIPQQVSGVIGGDQFRAAEIKPLAAKTRNSLSCLQKRLSGTASQSANHFRPEYINLT